MIFRAVRLVRVGRTLFPFRQNFLAQAAHGNLAGSFFRGDSGGFALWQIVGLRNGPKSCMTKAAKWCYAAI